MIARKNLEVLSEALGGEGVEEHAAVVVDGAELEVTLHPAGGAALGRVLEKLAACGLAALVRGGGSRLAFGNPPRGGDVLLATDGLSGVDDFDAGEGVCHALAGTPLSDIRARVNPEGWELPLDAPGRGATLGGVLASAAVGPRAQGLGRPRDVVLGLELAHGSGERTRCGGRVVKNVTGYDLAKLYTGSLGTLGVIEGAWLRLRPLPERVSVLEVAPEPLAAGCDVALAAARLPSARATALAVTPGSTPRLVVELAGDAATVEHDAHYLGSTRGAAPAPVAALDELRALQLEPAADRGLRFRMAVLPSGFEAVLEALLAGGAGVLAYPGLGLVYARFPLQGESRDEDDALCERAFQLAARLARGAGGGSVLESAPTWAKAGREIFGELGASLPLVKALKSRFDPGGVLNPGRFAGRV